MNKKKKHIIGWYIIGSAIIWGAAIVGCSFILEDTFNQIALLLNSAAGIHLILIWGPLAAQLNKRQKEQEAEVSKKE